MALLLMPVIPSHWQMLDGLLWVCHQTSYLMPSHRSLTMMKSAGLRTDAEETRALPGSIPPQKHLVLQSHFFSALCSWSMDHLFLVTRSNIMAHPATDSMSHLYVDGAAMRSSSFQNISCCVSVQLFRQCLWWSALAHRACRASRWRCSLACLESVASLLGHLRPTTLEVRGQRTIRRATRIRLPIWGGGRFFR